MTLKYFSVLTDYSNQPNLIISNLLSQRYLLFQLRISHCIQLPCLLNLLSFRIVVQLSLSFITLTFLKIQARYFGKCSLSCIYEFSMCGQSRNRINEPWARFSFRMMAPYFSGGIFVSWAVTWRAVVGTLKTDKGQVSPLTLPLEAWGWERLHFARSVGDCGRAGRGELTCIVTFPSEMHPKEKMPSLWHKRPHQGLSEMEGQG